MAPHPVAVSRRFWPQASRPRPDPQARTPARPTGRRTSSSQSRVRRSSPPPRPRVAADARGHARPRHRRPEGAAPQWTGRRASDSPSSASPSATSRKHPGALRPDLQLRGGRTANSPTGHSRDRKKGTSIVFGLLYGHRVSGRRQVFEGSTSDPHRRRAARQDRTIGLHRVVLVGDRGMLTVGPHPRGPPGVDGLRGSPLRAPTIRAGRCRHRHPVADQRDLGEVTSEDPRSASSVVPSRPERRVATELLAAIRERTRTHRPPPGAATTPYAVQPGIRVGKVINHYKRQALRHHHHRESSPRAGSRR